MKNLSLPLLVLSLVFLAGCADAPDTEMPPAAKADLTDALPAGADAEAIALHLLEAEHTAQTTRALVENIPGMDREMAYEVQLRALAQELAKGERLIGWKMGGTKMADPSMAPDPSFAYMLASDSLMDGQTLDPAAYVDGLVQVEAEVAFVMGKDLRGPEVTMEELRDAIGEVAGAIELISVKLVPSTDGTAPTIDHMIAGRLSHAGVTLTEKRVMLDEVDVAAEVGTAEVGGEEVASGAGAQIMNTTPLDAMLWIANALPKHGHYLRAGDIVITGSLYNNPTIASGQSATVSFTSLGELNISMGQ